MSRGMVEENVETMGGEDICDIWNVARRGKFRTGWLFFSSRRCVEIEEKGERKRLRPHFTRIIAQGLFWTSTCSNQFIQILIGFFQQCINNSREWVVRRKKFVIILKKYKWTSKEGDKTAHWWTYTTVSRSRTHLFPVESSPFRPPLPSKMYITKTVEKWAVGRMVRSKEQRISNDKRFPRTANTVLRSFLWTSGFSVVHFRERSFGEIFFWFLGRMEAGSATRV